MFGRATIRLSIGPHSSCSCNGSGAVSCCRGSLVVCMCVAA